MKDGPNIVGIAALIGDHARAEVLTALLADRALTATELAAVAGVTKQTISGHLAKLLDAGLVAVEHQGRHRYFRLADHDVAHLLESLMGVAFRTGAVRVRSSPREPALRKARVCYDHLAGELAVRAYERLVERRLIAGQGAGLRLTAAGSACFAALGIDAAAVVANTRRAACRPCLDWGERRHHLGGAIGAALLQRLFELRWASRVEGSRVVAFTPPGEHAFSMWLEGGPISASLSLGAGLPSAKGPSGMVAPSDLARNPVKKPKATPPPFTLPKAKTGIQGLDEITGGGLPRGRPTLVCGSAGCGKTMLAAEFIVRGATAMGEPGVFMSFEESAEEITANVRSLGFDLDKLAKQKKVALDFVRIERSEIEETGEYDLEGLFIRLGHAIDTIGAKRVVLDTIEALFAGLPNHAILRAELRRLFRWLKDRGVTAVITGERGENTLTRYGLEEYVADCVILLDHRIIEQISTRRLRVVKYRGTAHGTNEYPFLIGADGLSVLPITSMRLDHKALNERVSTGIAGLDAMLGGKGVYRGSSVLVSGSPGTGKSTVAVAFLDAACRRKQKALLFCYEESASQVIRNMRSIGIDLAPSVESGYLLIHATRPTLQGLEQHLVEMHKLVSEFGPAVVVVDPISNLTISNTDSALKATLLRLIDFLKAQGITGVFTSLTADGALALAETQLGISSLMDTWLLLANLEHNGERTRTLQVLKSRGMPHSNQVREFVLSKRGVELVDVCMPDNRVLTGSERVAHAARTKAKVAR